MERRDFIKNSILAGVTGLASTQVSAKGHAPAVNSGRTSNVNLQFNKTGKFKILQFTDTHYIAGNPKSARALENVNQMLDLEKPDLVIHTGDIIFGEPAEQSVRELLEPISKRKIPFAVAFGNHDEEFGKTREEMLDIIMTIPYNVNKKTDGIFGVTNSTITLSSSQKDIPDWVFYILDSNRGSTIDDVPNTYGHIHFDQIAWYRNQSEQFSKMNGGKPIPSLAFFHIPLPEHREGVKDDENMMMIGTKGEIVASPVVNSGMFVSMKEMKDIQAVFVGHDHDSDFALHWRKMFFIYGRFSGCDNVYNHLKPNGARVIELTQGKPGFRSWIRLYGGNIIQNLHYPGDFYK